jgi:hypothetical protein
MQEPSYCIASPGPPIVETAARNGEAKAAAEALDLLSTSTQASGTDWALGIEARSRSLLSEGQDAENAHVGRLPATTRFGATLPSYLLCPRRTLGRCSR